MAPLYNPDYVSPFGPIETKEFRGTRVFFFHYNKPASLKAGRPVMSVHVDGKCLACQALVVEAKTTMHATPDRQPHVVMKGYTRGYTQEGYGPLSKLTIHSTATHETYLTTALPVKPAPVRLG